MEFDKLKEYVDEGYSQRKIAELFGKSQASVKHWLQKYNLKTKYKPSDPDAVSKCCPRCNIIKSIDDFYTTGRISSWCKQCSSENVLHRQRKFKQECVEYKGGKCSICDYRKCLGALEFHHLELNDKEFEISKFRLCRFSDKVKEELDKCILVCSNCHREIHSSV